MLVYPNAAFQTIESPRTSAIDIDGTPLSASVFSITLVSTVFVFARSNRPLCAIAVGAGRTTSISRTRWRTYRRVIFVPWEERSGVIGRAKLTARLVGGALSAAKSR